MSLFSWWRRRSAPADDASAAAAAAWKALPPPDPATPLAEARFVVVDTETSGLDPQRAELLSIGACTVRSMALEVDACLDLRVSPQALTSHDNVLVHGIGHDQQAGGMAVADALAAWLTFCGRPFLVGFHALYDATILARHARPALGVRLPLDWLDVGIVLPELAPPQAERPRDLDGWLSFAGIGCPARHSAVVDAWATAQLLLWTLDLARSRGITDVRGLMALQSAALSRTTRGGPAMGGA